MSQPSSSVSAPGSNSNAALGAIHDSAAHAKAIQLASTVLETCAAAAVGNPTVAMSATHLVTTLLWQSMRWDPSSPRDATCDRIILSDAAFAPILYAAAADLGVPAFVDGAWRALASADLARFGAADGPLPTTPATGTLGLVEYPTAAHGVGVSYAVGNALVARLDGVERRVYVLVSEAELREGQLWEALAHVVEERLASVTPVFVVGTPASTDRAAQIDGPDALVRRLTALGFHATAIDGHAPAQIRSAVDDAVAKAKENRPTAIVARATKGWGVKFLQGGAWTGRIPTGDRLKAALEEIRSARVGLTRSFGSEIARPTSRAKDAQATHATGSFTESVAQAPDFARAMREADMLAVYQSGRLSVRRAHALALRVLGRAHPSTILLESDARTSATSELFAQDRALSSRFLEFRGAEAHMVSVAAALAAHGKVPFAAASARALTRAHEGIEVAARAGAHATFVATNAGLGGLVGGSSEASVGDVAWFRGIVAQRDGASNPSGYLLQPSDAFSAYALTIAAAEHDGVSMLRLPSGEQEFLYNAETAFNLGRFEILFEGTDLLIVTAGAMVHEVNRALDGLDDAGISATIVDLYSIPFDEEALLALANANGGRILVVEDNAGGALATAVSEACTSSGDAFTIESMCINMLPVSARTHDEALKAAGLSAADIVARARRMIGTRTRG
ncbi:MAG: transketolase C-terminal domain-containing protein [bacterium]